MRRKDREITDKSEIMKIIEKCDVCRLALSQNNVPYIIPMNFAHDIIDSKPVIYFHCAKEGKKIDIIRENSAACFELDCSLKVVVVNSKHYTMEYESVIGSGNVFIVEDNKIEEKQKALSLLIKKYSPENAGELSSDDYFTDEMLNSVTILKLMIDDFTGKQNIK